MKKSTTIILSGLACLILIGLVFAWRSDITSREKVLTACKRERDTARKALASRDSEIKNLLARIRSLEDMTRSSDNKLANFKETIKKFEEEPVNTANQEDVLDRWLGNITKLKNFIKAYPEYAIPEFKYLTTKDWLAASEGQIESEADYRKALADLRTKAKRQVFNVLRGIIEDFPNENGGQKPCSLEDVIKYLPEDFDPRILERYTTDPSGERHSGASKGWLIKEAYLVDDIWESEFSLADDGVMGIRSIGSIHEQNVQTAISNYKTEYGRDPTNSEEIMKYVKITADNGMSKERADKIFRAIFNK